MNEIKFRAWDKIHKDIKKYENPNLLEATL